jgi:hypothetical protein
MVQSRRPTSQRHQIMQRIEDLFARLVAAPVRRHHLVPHDDLDAIRVRLHRRGPEGAATRHAVTHAVETHQLVLVHLRGFQKARIKPLPRQRRRGRPILLESLRDRPHTRPAAPLTIFQAALPQVGVQRVQIAHPRHRRRPAALQPLHAVLRVGLLVAPRREAEQRLEHVMARQRRVTRVEPAIPATQQLPRDTLRIVPPNLTRHATEELQPLDHPLQDRFGPFGGQRHRKRTVRVRPDQNQHRNRTAPLGKVHVNLAEVGFQTLTRIVGQRNERLSLALAQLTHVATHRVVAPRIAVLVAKPLEDPHGRVTLLRRSLRVTLQNGPDDPVKGAQLRSRSFLTPRVRPRLGVGQHLPNLPPGMMKRPSDRPNAHPVTFRTSYPRVLVHREHPSLRKARYSLSSTSFRRLLWWVHFPRRSPSRPGPVLLADLHSFPRRAQ